MLRRVLLTISTTLWLWGMYVLYSAVVTPRLQPVEVESVVETPVARDGQESLERPPEFEVLAQNYLPDAPWAKRCDYQLHIDGAYLFTEKYERVLADKNDPQKGSDQIRFHKFALILSRENSKSKERPFTVVSEGAEITFAAKFGHLNPNTGRIIAGKLIGDVTLRGPDGLWVNGVNFFFAESNSPQLYSDSVVHFGQGRHTGSGQGLEVDFFPMTGAPPKDMPALDGIKTVRVRKDVHLELVREAEKGKGPALGHSNRNREQTLLIDCVQSLVFDLPKLTLNLKERVHVVQPTETGRSNKMECETLVLRLSTNDPKWGAAKGPKVTNWFPKRMELSGLVARGDDQHLVTLWSPDRDFRGEMAELQYEVETRTFVFKDDQRGVHLTQEAHHFDSPELRVMLDANQQLHTIRAPKEGSITAFSPKKEKFSATWKKEMVKHPAENMPGVDQLELVGDATLVHEQARQSLKGERILAWFKQKAEGDGKSGVVATSKGQSQSVTSGKEGDKQFSNVELQRVFAEQNVEADAPEFHARTGSLDLLFAESPVPLKQKGLERPAKEERPVAKKRGFTEEIAAREEAQQVQERDPVPRSPALITAKKILVHLLRHKNEVAVSDVISQGQVQLQQERPNGEPPAIARAEQMVVTNRGEGDQDLEFVGSPAELSDQGSILRGGKILVWTKQNKALVDGPGEFETQVRNGFDGKALADAQRLTVNWKEKVTFDGKKVSFIDTVRAVMDDSWMTCSVMNVTLSEQVPFAKKPGSGAGGKKPEIAHLECQYPVNFEQQQMERGALKMRSWGEAARFEMDKRTGKTLADGPGQIRAWQAKDGKSGAGPQKQLVRTSSEKTSKEGAGWDYVQVDFEGRMEGNFSQKFTTFYEKVFVLYGEVGDALEVIPRDELPDQGGTMECQELRVIQHDSTQPGQNMVSLLGRNNVRLESRAFEGRADEISYDQAKSRYVLNSKGRGTATIWHTGDKGERKVANARSWEVVVNGDSIKRMNVINSTGAGSE